MRGDFIVRGHRAVEGGVHVENARYASDSGKNAFLLRYDGRRRALVGIDAGIAGRIARSPVFQQRVLENGGDATAIPIHKAVVSCQFSTSSENPLSLRLRWRLLAAQFFQLTLRFLLQHNEFLPTPAQAFNHFLRSLGQELLVPELLL